MLKLNHLGWTNYRVSLRPPRMIYEGKQVLRNRFLEFPQTWKLYMKPGFHGSVRLREFS